MKPIFDEIDRMVREGYQWVGITRTRLSRSNERLQGLLRVDGVLRNVDRLKSGVNFKQSTDGLDGVGRQPRMLRSEWGHR